MNNKLYNYLKEKFKKKEEINSQHDKEINDIIKYAKEIRSDKEKYKKLEENYIKIIKTGNKAKTDILKNELYKIQSKITLSESILKNKLNNIKASQLKQMEKTKFINYICGVAKIKAKESKNIKFKNLEKSEIEKLNIEKEKILLSENITNVQKKNIIQKIDEEIIKLSKQD